MPPLDNGHWTKLATSTKAKISKDKFASYLQTSVNKLFIVSTIVDTSTTKFTSVFCLFFEKANGPVALWAAVTLNLGALAVRL